jgi:hypothetical protein
VAGIPASIHLPPELTRDVACGAIRDRNERDKTSAITTTTASAMMGAAVSATTQNAS